MENTETIRALIRRVTEKESKAGRVYHNVETDKGNFSCFEYDIAKSLMDNIGKVFALKIATSEDGKFKNIRGIDNSVEPKQSTAPAFQSADKFAEAREVKNQSMYASYAKDIFIALLARKPADKEVEASAIMMNACILVEQAKKAFS